jgi:hypothetical protein
VTSLTNTYQTLVSLPSVSSIYRIAAIWWCYRECNNAVCSLRKPHTIGILMPRKVRNHVTRGVTQSHKPLWKLDILLSYILKVMDRKTGILNSVCQPGHKIAKWWSVWEEDLRVGHLWNFPCIECCLFLQNGAWSKLHNEKRHVLYKILHCVRKVDVDVGYGT